MPCWADGPRSLAGGRHGLAAALRRGAWTGGRAAAADAAGGVAHQFRVGWASALLRSLLRGQGLTVPASGEQQQPTGYLAELSVQNPGLPDECLLASQRYDLPRIHKLCAQLVAAGSWPNGATEREAIRAQAQPATGCRSGQHPRGAPEAAHDTRCLPLLLLGT